MALTPRQERFCEEYIVDLNATQAAVRAGYSSKNADKIGSALVGKTGVSARIRELQADRSARTLVTADDVVRELKRLAFIDPRRVFSWGPDGVTPRPSADLSADDAAAVAEASQTTTEAGGSIRVKLADKLRALELLGKHLGMFLDRQQIDATARVVVVEELVDGDDRPAGPAVP